MSRCVIAIVFAVLSSVAVLMPTDASGDVPERIVSMAPSTTEILFTLGLGERVVGVTRYCDYPEAAKAVAKVGGYVDPNYEAILTLEPDLVILLASHKDAQRELAKMRVKTLTIPHDTIADIHESVRLIGEACGVPEKAAAMIAGIEKRRDAVQRAVKDRPKPSVLICIGRDTESGRLAGLYVAGRNGYYDEVIALAGGVNAYRDEKVAYPQLSPEGVVQLNPDVIIDLVLALDPKGKSAAEIAAQWDVLRVIKAVKNDGVHVIAGDYTLRPGPRYVQLLEALARVLHPKAFVKDPGDG